MHQSKPQTKSNLPAYPEIKVGIPNFKAIDPVSPNSHQLKNNLTKTPISDRSPVKHFTPTAHNAVQGQTAKASRTPQAQSSQQSAASKYSPSPSSAFETPKKKRAEEADMSAKEDYMSYMWRKKIEKAQGECPDTAQTMTNAPIGFKTPQKRPIKGGLTPSNLRSEKSPGFKGPKEVHADNVMGKESIQALIKASKVSKRSKSVTSLKKLIEKAKQGNLGDGQVSDRTNGDDLSTSSKNFVEKYVVKKEKDAKTPRQSGSPLFTIENYMMSIAKGQGEHSDYLNAETAAMSNAETGGLTPRSGLNASIRSKKSQRSEPGYARINRPAYSEEIWASPKRTQQVEIGTSQGEKTVKVVVKAGSYEKLLIEHSPTTIAVKSRTEYEHIDEQDNELRSHCDEEEEAQQEICEQEECAQEEVQEEEIENKEEELVHMKETETVFAREVEREENSVRSAAHHIEDKEEDVIHMNEREMIFAREIEREEKSMKSAAHHAYHNTPENEKCEEAAQAVESQDSNDNTTKAEYEEEEGHQEGHKANESELLPEHQEDVMEVKIVQSIEILHESPEESPREEQEKDTLEVPKQSFIGSGSEVINEAPQDEEDDEEEHSVLAMYQKKMAKIETWKQLGDHENQINLLKELIHNLEEYEQNTPKGETEGEVQNIVPHKIHSYNRLAVELYETGEYEKALDSCRKVAEMDKCNIQALNKAYQIHNKLGNATKAKDILSRIKKLMQTPILLQYNQQFLLENVALSTKGNSQGTSSQGGDMFASRLSFFNYGS